MFLDHFSVPLVHPSLSTGYLQAQFFKARPSYPNWFFMLNNSIYCDELLHLFACCRSSFVSVRNLPSLSRSCLFMPPALRNLLVSPPEFGSLQTRHQDYKVPFMGAIPRIPFHLFMPLPSEDNSPCQSESLTSHTLVVSPFSFPHLSFSVGWLPLF